MTGVRVCIRFKFNIILDSYVLQNENGKSREQPQTLTQPTTFNIINFWLLYKIINTFVCDS